LLGINGVLDPPPDLAHLVSQHKSVSYFNKILTPGSNLISEPDVSNSA
jgi:solute carrier family 25 carnitine/acylcarnitine transporter 20/29